MKNITLAIDETVLEEVRLYAAKRQTSVNGLVRDFLGGIAAQENRTERARRRLGELMDRSTLEAGPIGWKREDLYDR
ncbi:MAG: BrnA antitoxin family protein [Beijerinckiaceae bacterium]|nr:BrnA antitoxin family protein [Beijerinckiaceae bacterium]